VAAVDARVDEINGVAGIVYEIFSRGAARDIGLVPHPIGAWVL
jgi:hypothetical protein